MAKKDPTIIIAKDGPYLLLGNVPIDTQIIVIGPEGDPEKWVKGKNVPSKQPCSLCRCGKSKTPPFCDGSHVTVGFDGTETASRMPFDKQAEVIDGPTLRLKDVVSLCALARFCDKGGGIWELTRHSDGSKARALAIEEARCCPAGRLVECDQQTGKVLEKTLEKTISLVEDPQNQVSGPLWVKGGIPVESVDGTTYEIRNRVTLCRCGKSQNKPFCDGSHIDEGFSDGDNSLNLTQ